MTGVELTLLRETGINSQGKEVIFILQNMRGNIHPLGGKLVITEFLFQPDDTVTNFK